MSNFDRVLSDDDINSIIKNTTMLLGQSISRSKDLILKVEQAVLAKLAEQEPVAYAAFAGNGNIRIWTVNRTDVERLSRVCDQELNPLYAHPCVSPMSDEAACVSESWESDTQTSSQGILDSSNHVADNNEMVADMYWINPDYPSYTSILDAFDPVQSAVEVEIGDRFEVSRAKTLPDLTIEVTELEENGDVKDFKVLSGDHVVDSDKMVTPLAQRKIQTLLDKGEYRVIENATVLVNENGHAAIVNRGGAFYWVDNEGLAREFDAAPKYTGEK